MRYTFGEKNMGSSLIRAVELNSRRVALLLLPASLYAGLSQLSIPVTLWIRQFFLGKEPTRNQVMCCFIVTFSVIFLAVGMA